MLNLSSNAWQLSPEFAFDELPVNPAGKRIGVIWNPRSHRNVGTVPEWRGAPSVSVAMPMTRGALELALMRFADAGIETLMINGGDGTVRDVLTCGAPIFGDHWPRLAMVPRGKTNALAIDLGLPRAWTFEETLAGVEAGRTVRRRPLVIDNAWGGRSLWGFIFGAGAFNAAIDTGQVAHRFGAFQSAAIGLTAALGLTKALFGIGSGPWRRTAPMRLHEGRNNEDLPHSGRGDTDQRYVALFSTLRSFPLHIAPFRKHETDIRYLLIDAPIRRVTARLPMILRGAETPADPVLGIHRGSGTEFRIELGERFVLDGETFGPGALTMRQGPELSFIVP